ncbi:hypothetical protein CHS0354_020608 [Potamilus streckersoni]|uniref:Uncharacterized protein n=1 Tax=Potamilus streckersoni TaxID=2493646 RepID=A0AAE0RRD3_9BIVA|nr:hypothetical protein CHS0354_020608 [Potamilus streckersoni]
MNQEIQWKITSLNNDGTKKNIITNESTVSVAIDTNSGTKHINIANSGLCRLLGWPDKVNPVNAILSLEYNFTSGRSPKRFFFIWIGAPTTKLHLSVYSESLLRSTAPATFCHSLHH